MPKKPATNKPAAKTAKVQKPATRPAVTKPVVRKSGRGR